MVVIEESDSSLLGILNDAVPEAERIFANDMITVHVSTVTVNRENVDASYEKGIIFLRVSRTSLKISLSDFFTFHFQDVIASCICEI